MSFLRVTAPHRVADSGRLQQFAAPSDVLQADVASYQLDGGVTVEQSGEGSRFIDESGLALFAAGRPRLVQQNATGERETIRVDAAELARLWSREGARVFDRVVGEAAILIWDQRASRFHAFVDPYGNASLFYAQVDGAFAIATESLALVRLSRRPSIDTDAFRDAFNIRFLCGAGTLWKGVRQVTPGYRCEITRDGAVTEIEVPRFTYAMNKRTQTLTEATAAIHATLKADYERRRDEGVTDVVVPLSGGIDSSILAALAKRTFPRVTAFSATIDQFDNPELPRARAVAERLGLTMHEVPVSYSDVARLYPHLIDRIQEPPRHYNNFVVARLLEVMSGAGSLVISGDNAGLFGIGSMAVFAKYQQKRRTIDRLPAPLTRLLGRLLGKSSTSRRGRLQTLLSNDLRQLVQAMMVIPTSDAAAVALRGAIADGLPSADLLHRQFDERTGIAHAQLMWCYNIVEGAIFRRNTRFAASKALEYWYPLQSPGALDVASTLATEHLFDFVKPLSKPILRALCAEVVAPDVAAWGKLGFPTPELEWMEGPLGGYLERSLLDGSHLAPFFDLRAIRALPRKENQQTLWTLMTLHDVIAQVLPPTSVRHDASMVPDASETFDVATR